MEHGACPALGEINVSVGNRYLKCPQNLSSFPASGTQENYHAPASCLQLGAWSTGRWRKEREDTGVGRGQCWSKQDPTAQHELRTTNLEGLETFQGCLTARPVTPQNFLSVSTGYAVLPPMVRAFLGAVSLGVCLLHTAYSRGQVSRMSLFLYFLSHEREHIWSPGIKRKHVFGGSVLIIHTLY